MTPETGAAILFGILAIVLLVIGAKRGFFRFSPRTWKVPLSLSKLIAAFAIYFAVDLFLAPLLVSFFHPYLARNYVLYASALNFTLAVSIFAALCLFAKTLPTQVTLGILRREGEEHSIRNDLSQALYAWILAFPFVLSFSQFLEQIVRHVLGKEILPEQVAVRFLKATFAEPTALLFAILSITVLAPLVEETLFRGFLQTYIRQHLGAKYAILVTSVCFALFHFSFMQGYGNIPIISSLFIFSLFLGFLYEKQGSLLSPIFLHSTFNTISVLNLYLFGGLAPGL